MFLKIIDRISLHLINKLMIITTKINNVNKKCRFWSGKSHFLKKNNRRGWKTYGGWGDVDVETHTRKI